MNNDISFLSVKELGRIIRRKEISPVEVTKHFLNRIDTRNPSLNAFVYVDHESALKRAKAAEDAVMRGEIGGKPLLGIPVAAKDIGPSIPGWPDTMGGIRALKKFSFNHTSWFMDRMIQAGAIPVGKTNTPIFAFRGVTDNYLFGVARNPFCTDRNPGGSSGGSAAAVADGLVPLAEGSDAGGSIRIPAAWNNLFGYKASFGRFPGVHRPNAFELAHIFMVSGPMAKSVEDVTVALNACRGADGMDPFYMEKHFDFAAPLNRSLKGMRIAFSPDFGIYPVEPDIRKMIEESAKRFEELGAQVVPVDIKWDISTTELTELWCRLCAITTVINIRALKEKGIEIPEADIPAEVWRWIHTIENMSLVESLQDEQIRTLVYDTLERVMSEYDLLITPTLGCHPPVNSDDGNTKGPDTIDGTPIDPLIGFCLTAITSLTGHASASVPAGLSQEGYPVGMQLIGKRFGDSDVLAASAAYERISPWNQHFKRTEKRTI